MLTDAAFEEYLKFRDFQAFYKRTEPDWRRLARKLARQHRPPPWVGVDDLVQTMLVSCLRFVDEWDPSRGAGLARFVIFRCYDCGKKYVHSELATGRDEFGRVRMGAPRVERCLSSMLAPGQPYQSVARLLDSSVAPEQERRLMVREAAAKSAALALFYEFGDGERAALSAISDEKLRRRYRVGKSAGSANVKRARRRLVVAATAAYKNQIEDAP